MARAEALASFSAGRPWFDKLTMRINSLKTLDLILSLSKDEAKFFQQPARLLFIWKRGLHARTDR
jgi:hypothetical protein